jgi:hypothetical protein
MNTFFGLIAIIGGIAGSLVAYDVIKLDKFMDPHEAEDWHRKWGKIFKIICPAAILFGLWYLLF